MTTPKDTAKKTVTVALRRSYGYRGRMYGPGEAVEVPASFAEALGLGAEAVAPADAAGETFDGAAEPRTPQAEADAFVQGDAAAPPEAPGAVLVKGKAAGRKGGK